MVLLDSSSALRLDAGWVDYLLVAIYFVFVLGIGLLARASVSSTPARSRTDRSGRSFASRAVG